jgi:trans-aconitate methyltransferase
MLGARLGTALDRRVRRFAPARTLRFDLVAEALERAAAGRPLRVLDAGCGEGLFAAAIARSHPGWTVVGADVSGELLERARLGADRLPNLELVEADLTGDLGADAYHAVVAIECLEEIADDTLALRRMISALRPGGVLVLHVPERDWKPVLAGSAPAWKHEVRHGYEARELATRLAQLGLERISVVATSRGLVRLAQEARDRVADRHLAVRAALVPFLTLAVVIERKGVTWGAGRSLLVRARKPVGSDALADE